MLMRFFGSFSIVSNIVQEGVFLRFDLVSLSTSSQGQNDNKLFVKLPMPFLIFNIGLASKDFPQQSSAVKDGRMIEEWLWGCHLNVQLSMLNIEFQGLQIFQSTVRERSLPCSIQTLPANGIRIVFQ